MSPLRLAFASDLANAKRFPVGFSRWIQQDGTEDGIATDLMVAGIPKERIVLGFKRPESRKYTEFAVA